MHPSKIEVEFLNLSYNRFIDLYEEIMPDEFWDNDSSYRLLKCKDIFSVYTEILKYPPIGWVIENNKRPNFSEVGVDLFKFIRNILLHFPYFKNWDEIFINSELVNLYSKKPQFIDRYLRNNEGKEELKYRFWEEAQKRMTYVTIKFPVEYTSGSNIYLKDILEEKSGIKFSLIFMRSILFSQIEKINQEG